MILRGTGYDPVVVPYNAVFALIKRLDLPVDQCIDEKGCRWIHVSHRPGHNRRLYMIF